MAAVPDRGYVTIDTEECKGCGLCLEACPPRCLEFEPELNAYGVRPARYLGRGCTGCGICFYACPEPGAITVYRVAPPPKSAGTATGEASHAPAL
ncbi:MAG: ferredoxin family protein [Acidobacteria bacterium]|nr:ferredoxin family protein [Acidobacteriota bacterium]